MARTFLLVSGVGDRASRVEIVSDEQVRVDDRDFRVRREADGSIVLGGNSEGERTTVAWATLAGDVRWVFVDGHAYEITEAQPTARRRTAHAGSLSAPMPATVRRVLVSEGDVVQAGDTLLILEAMKMELPIRASGAGRVRAVRCREGELVQPGTPLVEIGEDTDGRA